MINFQQFLNEACEEISDQRKLRRFYLQALSKNIDKAFIIDLARVHPQLLPPGEVLREGLDFIDFFIKSPKEKNLNTSFNSFIVF